jgi:hypothetical protein
MQTRWLVAAAIAVTALLASRSAADPNDPDRTLTAKDVQRYFEPYVPAVQKCYLTTAGKNVNGTLRLELIIEPGGGIFRFGFVAPGVPKRRASKLDTCLRKLVPSWHFPARKGFTTAVVPFLFQKTTAPGAGPIRDCADARGCPPGKLEVGGSR